MKFKHTLLEFDVPNLNNRVYTKNSLTKIPTIIPLRSGFEEDSNIVGSVENIQVEDNKLVGNIIVTDPNVKAMIDSGAILKYPTGGVGEVVKENDAYTVINFTLNCVVVTC